MVIQFGHYCCVFLKLMCEPDERFQGHGLWRKYISYKHAVRCTSCSTFAFPANVVFEPHQLVFCNSQNAKSKKKGLPSCRCCSVTVFFKKNPCILVTINRFRAKVNLSLSRVASFGVPWRFIKVEAEFLEFEATLMPSAHEL
jgi:hypothetical protein